MIVSDLTVAIVSYRTPELADRCAASVNTGELRARTIIVETGDCTATPPVPSASRFFMSGLGYAAALNRVFRAAASPWLVASNADVEFPAESIEPLIDLFEQHPRLALIGPRQVTPDGRIAHAGILDAGDTSGGRCYGDLDVGQLRHPLETLPQVSGSVMILRNQAYREVGGMARMPRLYYEDAILCHRLRHAGWMVAYSGLQTFVHHVAASPVPGAVRAEDARLGRQAWERELALT